MCGRFALTASPEEVREILSLMELEGFPPRYNIAPTQPILVAVAAPPLDPGSNRPDRMAVLVRWGLVPSWVKDPKEFTLLLNARSETAIEKASFRAAMRHRRVLVPASGFYEWHRPSKESGEALQAYWIRPKRGGIVCFGGLMETYMSKDGSELDTGCILTVGANRTIGEIHDRMPVVIQPEDFSRWLDCRNGEPRDIADLLRPADEDYFEAIPVSDLVNKVANVGPELQSPVTPAPRKQKPAADKSGDGQMSLF
jgi:putative SOS response-associated peptidase YedK